MKSSSEQSELALASWGWSADTLELDRGHTHLFTHSKPLQPLHYLSQGLMSMWQLVGLGGQLSW